MKEKDYTSSRIEAELLEEAKKMGYTDKNSKLFDVFVMYNDGNGWYRVTSGEVVQVTIPYNLLTSEISEKNAESYNIKGWHLFETIFEGSNAKIEFLSKDTTAEGSSMSLGEKGVVITLSTYSPVLISWKQDTRSGGAGFYGNGAVRTGDEAQMMVWAASGLASAAGALGIGSQLKKGKEKEDDESRGD